MLVDLPASQAAWLTLQICMQDRLTWQVVFLGSARMWKWAFIFGV